MKIASRIADTDNVEMIKKRANVTIGSNNNNNDLMDDDRMMSDMSSRQIHRCSIVNCGKEFKLKAHLARHYAQAHGIAIRSGSPRPIMKTRTAFFLQTTLATRLSRKLCRHLIKPRKAARQPSYAINVQAVKVECELTNRSHDKYGNFINVLIFFLVTTAVTGKSIPEMKTLLLYKKRDRGSVTHIANRLGNPGSNNEWLKLTPKENMPKPDVVAFPKPPKAPDGSLMYDRVPNKAESEKAPSNSSSPSLKRRFEDVNGMDGEF